MPKKQQQQRVMLDAHSNAMLTELHRKERRCTVTGICSVHSPKPIPRLLELQLRTNERVQAALREGMMQGVMHQTPAAAVPPPPHTHDPLDTISRALWTNTPGYIQPATRYTSVTSSSIGTFDEEELRFLQVP